ncbi:MAG: tRNA lysidine(34) synthetase TilS [Gammaproteobacteria bacterium]
MNARDTAAVRLAFERDLAAALAALITRTGPRTRIRVAFSGGRDSSVLLHALTRLDLPDGASLHAIHLDHGLQHDSAAWAVACAAVCARLHVPCVVERLTVRPPPGASLEAWARDARYACFARVLTADDLIVTAHHEDDQAETFLLAALRGAGPAGLRGIAPVRPMGRGWVGRPLLDFTAGRIAAYADAAGITWHTDPMNDWPTLSRGYLRSRVLPALRAHWPAASRTLARDAAWQRDVVGVLEELADAWITTHAGAPTGRLPVAPLRALTPATRSAVLRRWIAQSGLPLPDATQLERVQACVIGARPDRVPECAWKGVRVRRHDGMLHLLRDTTVRGPAFDVEWAPPAALRLPGGVLHATPVTGSGLSASIPCLRVRPRRGGERCRLPGRTHHHRVKDLLQQARVPAWVRGELPFLYVDDTLAAVAGLCVCADFAAGQGEPGWQLHWTSGHGETG